MDGKFYAIQQAGKIADVYIFGDITSWAWPEYGEVSGVTLKDEIKGLDVDEINVHINSFGGSVAEGWAIYNTLIEHRAKINTYADGFVASAALYPFLAGDERHASDVSAFYMHKASSYASGYASDLRKAADELDIITNIGKKAFIERAGMLEADVEKLMEDETWLTPEQAAGYGIATDVRKSSQQGQMTQSVAGDVFRMLCGMKQEPEPGKPEEKKEPEKQKPKNKFFERYKKE